MKRALLVLLLAFPAAAGAEDTITFLGAGREIPRSLSASRDAPAFAIGVLPRATTTASGEFALLVIPARAFTMRSGFYGLLELESDSQTETVLNGAPTGDVRFWRGSYGYYGATSWTSLARRLCDGCALETTLMFRHESEHYTGSNLGDPGIDYSDRPHFGDAMVLDAAIARDLGKWLLSARVQNGFFLPNRSAYTRGPGADLQIRYRAFPKLHLVASGYAEYLFGADTRGYRFPDAYLVRGIGGVALPSDLGDVLVYLSADVGHRKGLAAYSEEATVGFGVRLALGI